MDNFLKICQDVRSEAGLSGSGPVSIATAIGIEKKIVRYVRDAWKDVQEYRSDWPWMFKEFSFNTSPNKARYPCSELNLTDVERWDLSGTAIYKTADGKSGEEYLGSTTYASWWNFLRVGEQTAAQPQFIFVDPVNNDLMLFPEPDDEYTITLRYYRSNQVLAADGDIPLMPTNNAWQNIIMWRALRYYGFHDGAPDVLSEADEQWDRMIHALDNRYGANIVIQVRPIA